MSSGREDAGPIRLTVRQRGTGAQDSAHTGFERAPPRVERRISEGALREAIPRATKLKPALAPRRRALMAPAATAEPRSLMETVGAKIQDNASTLMMIAAAGGALKLVSDLVRGGGRHDHFRPADPKTWRKVVHGYWGIRGLGQPIRLILEYAGMPYDDKRYYARPNGQGGWDLSDWLDEKYKLGLDFPNLPYLIDGELRLSQTNAILLYLADKAGLSGRTPEQRALANMLLAQSLDLRNPYVKLSYETNPVNHESLKEQFAHGYLPPKLKELSHHLHKMGNRYLTGPEVNFIDLVYYDLLEQFLVLLPACLDATPNLRDLVYRVANLPRVLAYTKSHRFIDRPFNNAMAMFK